MNSSGSSSKPVPMMLSVHACLLVIYRLSQARIFLEFITDVSNVSMESMNSSGSSSQPVPVMLSVHACLLGIYRLSQARIFLEFITDVSNVSMESVNSPGNSSKPVPVMLSVHACFKVFILVLSCGAFEVEVGNFASNGDVNHLPAQYASNCCAVNLKS